MKDYGYQTYYGKRIPRKKYFRNVGDFGVLASIEPSDAFIVGVYLLPQELAIKYVKLFFDSNYSVHHTLTDLFKVPDYIAHTLEYLNGDVDAFNKVPPGSNYGFRQVMRILVDNGLTPERARDNIIDLYPLILQIYSNVGNADDLNNVREITKYYNNHIVNSTL